jgi:predicted DCC family thiol-disulfide oxidoreductase YuxK
MKDENFIILFDGVCNLCNFFVQFVLKRDPKQRFQFASLQSEYGKEFLLVHQIPLAVLSSVIFVENGVVYWKSAAALRILRWLSMPWPLLYFLIVIPRPIRDFCYDFVANRRYRWFGKADECMVPTPELRKRFLG